MFFRGFFFFFQAEDGIRDGTVTGVQTCALPIWGPGGRRIPMLHEYAAIDPMALLFPSRVYISLSEKLHPHVPKSIEIKEALGRLTPEERLYILQRARVLSHYSKAVEEAVAGMK